MKILRSKTDLSKQSRWAVDAEICKFWWKGKQMATWFNMRMELIGMKISINVKNKNDLVRTTTTSQIICGLDV